MCISECVRSLQRVRLESVVWVDLVSVDPHYLLLAAITEDPHGHTDDRLLIYRSVSHFCFVFVYATVSISVYLHTG